MFDQIVDLDIYRQPYFSQIILDYNIWENLDEVEPSDRELLEDFFYREKIGVKNTDDDIQDWLWLWRRRLKKYYPLYLDSKNAWLEMKQYKWLWDNEKNKKLIHDEEGTRDYTTDATGTNSYTSAEKGTGQSLSENNAKNRSFAFAYPESNYSGGVIPYDLNSDPNVEFISTQSDGISKSSDETTTQDTRDATGEGKTTENNIYDGEHTLDYTDTWTERGDSISELMPKIISNIAASNFFEQLTEKLRPLFIQTLTTDECR